MPNRRGSIADFVGFVSYLFVVGNGRPDVKAIRAALETMGDADDVPAPVPTAESPPWVEQLGALDFEPLVVTNVGIEARALEPVGAGR